ncbi:ArsR/SmtB family transcription factor [Pyxidicoccus sp. 3LG]
MDVFVAIADPTRRQLLDLLRGSERPAGELAEAFPRLTQPGISRHLRVLREAGLVSVRRDEQRRMYSLRPEGLVELDAWISTYRPFWEAQLDSLERHLDRRAQTAPRPRRRRNAP